MDCEFEAVNYQLMVAKIISKISQKDVNKYALEEVTGYADSSDLLFCPS